MFAIAKYEFWQLMKSVKSIIIIILLLLSSYYVAKNGQLLAGFFQLNTEESSKIYTIGISFLLIAFGQLFVVALSHDVINREGASRTMRFLITRTSHERIFFGKFFGVVAFWGVCLTISFIVITFFAKSFDSLVFSQLICLLIFYIALVFALSVVITRPMMSMFLGIVIGLALPIFYLYIEATEKWWSFLKYISPIHYLVKDDWSIFILLVEGMLIIIATLWLFKRREY